jgi:tetratricopeptide (TPR) repeat protein
MTRLLRLASLALVLGYAAPTLAQFQGLDLDSSNTGKKKHRGKKKKKGAHAGKAEPAAPAAAPAAPATASKPADVSLPPVPTSQQGTPDTSRTTAAPPAAAPGGMGLDLSSVPAAKPGTPTAPTLRFEAVELSGKSGDRQRLDQAIGQFKDKKYEAAAINSWDLMNDPKMIGSALEAQYVLAKSLYRMGLYHSSLGEFSAILSHGPDTRFFQPSLEWLFFISHKTANEGVILDEIAKYASAEFPEKFKSEFHYLLARYYFVRGRALDQVGREGEASHSFDEVKKLTAQFTRDDPFYARAKYLEGLAEFRNGTDPRALAASLEAMKEVVRLTRPGLRPMTDDEARQTAALRELAFMQLARTHYGARQNRFAIYYYAKVDRGDPQWLEALFESAWASYRIGQYEQALGNLITLSSPFFREEYFPEALILKAVIYYENCRYRESNSILAQFESLYGPVHDELDKLVKQDLDAPSYYSMLEDIQRKKGHKSKTDLILERVLKLALTDKDLKNTNDSIQELEEEMDALGKGSDAFRLSNLAKHMTEVLKGQRKALVDKAGLMAKGKLQFELGELTKLLGDGERIRFETTGKEKEFLEEQLAQGGKAEIVKKYRYTVAVADDQLYWPYEGEYWRDELGTYQYTLTKGCIERKGSRFSGASLGDTGP